MIGTTVCAMPAVNAIHAAFPSARVRLFGFDPVSRFLCDEACGQDLVLLHLERLAAELRQELGSPPDLAFDMLCTPESLGALAGAGAGQIVGWPDNAGHVTVPVPFPSTRQQLAVQDYLDFVLAVGAAAPLSTPRLTAAASTRQQGDEWLARQGLGPDETLFVLGIGGGNVRKRWPLERFLELEQHLLQRGRSVFFLGPREAELAQGLHGLPGRHLVAASLPLDLAKGIIARARLAVCNDHAIMHLAAALGVPTVGIFLASDPREWFPYPPPSSHVIGPPLDCRPCYSEECDDWACNDPSLPDQVRARVDDLLG